MADYVETFLPRVFSAASPTIPPLPVIRKLALSWCDASEEFEIPIAVLDTGSDYSVLPNEWALIAALHGLRMRIVTIVLPDGKTRPFNYVIMRFKIPDLMADWDRAVFLVMDEYLIGRNILQKFIVTLNGPAEELTISAP